MTGFNFTQVLRGMFFSSSAPEKTSKTTGQCLLLEGSYQLVVDFLNAVAEKEFDTARTMLSADFRAHEPNLNRISSANELLFDWEVNSKVFVYQNFTVKKTATFSVFGDIDRDKYVYVQAERTSLKSYCNLQRSSAIELIARIEGNKIVHLLYSTGPGKVFNKLSSVQHARLLARSV